MNMAMKRVFVILAIFLGFTAGCEKAPQSGLEIYLLTDYQTKSPGKEIIAGSEMLSKDPLIYYNDIISYDSTDHCFLIGTSKIQELNHKEWSVQGTAFSLTINRSVIYSGYFMPGYSSLAIDWISIDPLSVDSKIRVSLGYPGDLSQLANHDPRNDERIINLLLEDHKLKP
jgi:hypothetical protein